MTSTKSSSTPHVAAVNQASSGGDPPDPRAAGGTGSRAETRLPWSSPLAVWFALAAAIVLVLANNPADRRPDLLGGCGWYTLFGTNGPTCGGTRMVWYLLHGDIVNAARMHLVALIGAPFALYALVQWSAERMFGLRLPRLRLKWWVYAAYGVAFVLFGAVLRNLPGFEWFHISYMQPGLGL